jgi:transposase
MRVQLAQQAQEILGQSDLVLITERVDDVALLIGQMVKMGLVEVLDRHLPRPWKQRRVRWGWTAVIWRAYILPEGDHRQVSVEAYITGMHHTLSHRTGQRIAPLDFSDDRLSHRLTPLSKPPYWQAIDQDFKACSLEVHALSQDVIRCEATTVSGDHDVTDGGLLPCGHSNDDPTRPQINVRIGSLDPVGMPLATEVLSGERADDGLYMPLIARIASGRHRPGLLVVGDCTMSALATRAYLAQRAHLYLSPLPLTGATAEAMADWITEGIRKDRASELVRMSRGQHREQTVLAAAGYEFKRSGCLEDGEGGKTAWSERVLVRRSPMHAAQQTAGLEQRLATAAKKRAALTPARGRGKRQMTDEGMFVEAMANVLKEQRVAGVLRMDWARQIERRTHDGGRGRGSATRAQRVSEHLRDHLTHSTRQDGPIAALLAGFGWKACVTNATPERLSLAEAVLCSRNDYRVERIFHRLKSRVHITPLLVTQDDHIEGLTYLRTLGVRVLTVTEFVLRRALAPEQTTLPGLHPENTRTRTGTPTAERLLHAFAGVSLTIRQSATGEEILRRMTPFSGGQETILHRLGLGTQLYRQLAIQNMGS